MTNHLTRRDVLRYTAAAGAAALLPSVTRGVPSKKLPIGLELYSLRNQLPKDFTGVIVEVGKMGYDGVEFASTYYGWDKKPKDLRKLLDDNNLKCCGVHTPLNTLVGENLKRTIELHKTLGNKFLICPSMNGNSAKAWEDNAKRFNEIAGRAKEDDMFVGYHSHASDYKKFDGKTAWEIFFDNTHPEVIHQLDIGNTLEGGGDPLALVKKYPGRTRTTHVKEYGGGPEAAIGEGTVDWKAMLEAYTTVGGTEWYVVEHETSKDPLKIVKRCLDNLRKMQA
jgi:sugar phosphate isomerase/epimerase